MSKVRRDVKLSPGTEKVVQRYEGSGPLKEAIVVAFDDKKIGDRAVIGVRAKVDPKLAPKPSAHLSADAWTALAKRLPEGFLGRLKRGWEIGVGHTLSARTPVLAGIGHIDGFQIQVYDPVSPALWFVYGQGILEIWLEGLEVGAGYTLEVRVTGYGGRLRIGTSETPAAHVTVGYQQTLPIFIPAASGALALIRIEAEEPTVSWGFYDATVRRIT